MFISLAAALVAAFCYGIGAVLQAIAVRAASRRPVLVAAGVADHVDPSLVIRMFRQWPFVVSLLIDFVGFVCQLIALRRLPIFEVQVIIASNLAVTAVFASWLMHTVLSLREWASVIAVVVGVGLLGSSAGAQGAAKVGIDFHLALIAALAAIGVGGFAAGRLPSQFRTPVLGAIAGLGYGVLAVCARILPGFTPVILIKSPAAYTLAAAGIISFMLYAAALESGSVTVATAAVIMLETVPPALIGVLFLGDTTRPGLTGPAIAGFVLALISAIALARFGEAGVQKEQAAAGGAAGADAGAAETAGAVGVGGATSGPGGSGAPGAELVLPSRVVKGKVVTGVAVAGPDGAGGSAGGSSGGSGAAGSGGSGAAGSGRSGVTDSDGEQAGGEWTDGYRPRAQPWLPSGRKSG